MKVKVKVVYIKTKELDDSAHHELHISEWEVRTFKPDYEETLWQKFVLIPVDDEE